MCELGNDVMLKVKMSAKRSYTGKERWDIRGIDKCIAPIIKALTEAGIYTDGCCCGHRKKTGYIILHDGRILIILDNEKLFDEYRILTNHGSIFSIYKDPKKKGGKNYEFSKNRS